MPNISFKIVCPQCAGPMSYEYANGKKNFVCQCGCEVNIMPIFIETLAPLIGVDKEDISEATAQILISAGRGIFWSAELHEKAKALQFEIEAELDRQAMQS